LFFQQGVPSQTQALPLRPKVFAVKQVSELDVVDFARSNPYSVAKGFHSGSFADVNHTARSFVSRSTPSDQPARSGNTIFVATNQRSRARRPGRPVADGNETSIARRKKILFCDGFEAGAVWNQPARD